MVERGRRDGEFLVAGSLAVGRALMIADHAQHRLRVGPVTGEGAALGGDLRRGRIGASREDRGERGADRTAVVAVVGNARGHEQAADIGVAEAERTVVVRKARDLA